MLQASVSNKKAWVLNDNPFSVTQIESSNSKWRRLWLDNLIVISSFFQLLFNLNWLSFYELDERFSNYRMTIV